MVCESVEATESLDVATHRTVQMMGRYIKQACSDARVRACASYAWRRFGAGLSSPAAIAWAVFWYIRHCLRFRRDEGVLSLLGMPNEHDLLIAPSVLSRMKDPAEDCDGHSMFVTALLCILGLPVAIATVATEPERPQRWSHVFALASAGAGRWRPIDASHGRGPGWMVPWSRVFRFQAWDLEGRRIDIPFSSIVRGPL